VTVGVVHCSLLFANDCDFVVKFIISVYVVLSWCAAYSCSNAYVKRKPEVAFSVSEAPVECMLTWPATGPYSCSLDDQYITVQCKTRATTWTTDTSSLGLGKAV